MRRLVLFAALAGTLGLVIFDFTRGERATGASVRPTPGAGSADTKAEGPLPFPGGDPTLLALPERADFGGVSADLFGSRDWQPPVPKIAVGQALPTLPTAPPLPYRYAGKVVRDGRTSMLLSRGDEVFAIKEGQTLDGTYRVEAITETQITLLYLPLKQRESIPAISMLPARRPGQPGPATAVGAAPDAPGGTPRSAGAAAITAGPGSTGEARKSESGPAQLLWEGPQRVKLGSRFEVTLKVTSGEPVQASPMQLRFDPTFLEFLSAKPGKLFGDGKLSFVYRSSPDGSIFVGASSPSAAPVSDAELLVLTFKPLKAAPAAELSIASLNLQGPTGRAIAFSRIGAFKTTIMP